jgi:GntR family transcriptional regulator
MVTIENLDFRLETGSAVPLYEQIKREIKHKIISGSWDQHEQLPTIRDCAKDLKVNPNTIVKVYYQLDSEGYIYSKPGQGHFVSEQKSVKTLKRTGLFRDFTEEYLRKATDLGFSIHDVLKELQNRLKKMT